MLLSIDFQQAKRVRIYRLVRRSMLANLSGSNLIIPRSTESRSGHRIVIQCTGQVNNTTDLSTLQTLSDFEWSLSGRVFHTGNNVIINNKT